MANDPRGIATTYFTAWKAQDFDTLRSILAKDATFRGPMGSADSDEEFIAGLKGMSQMMTDIDVSKVWVDGPDVLTWFDLHTEKASPTPTVNWMHIENGRSPAFESRSIPATSSAQADSLLSRTAVRQCDYV